MDQEVLEARARLAARFANGTQLGGKGKFVLTNLSFLTISLTNLIW
jgi:hypothetical protein